MGDSIREDIEAARASLEGASDAGAEVEGVPGSNQSGAGGDSDATGSGGGSALPGANDELVEAGPSAAQRARDEKGRFAGKAAETQAPAEVAPSPAVAPVMAAKATTPAPVVAAAPEVKAPQSWTPAARESWTKVPPDVQQEINRREREMQVAMQDSAPAKRFAETFKQVIAPYEAGIRAEGGEPLAAIQSLFQTAQSLRGPHRAQVVAQLVKQFKVDINELDSALAGESPAQGQQQPQGEYKDPRMDALLSQLRDVAQAKQQRQTQKLNDDLVEFASKNEFFQDVKPEMALLFRQAHEDGLTLSINDAYKRACRMNDNVWTVIQQREAHKAATAPNAATQRARAAASSVKTQPAGASGASQSDGSVRADLEAAMRSLSGR